MSSHQHHPHDSRQRRSLVRVVTVAGAALAAAGMSGCGSQEVTPGQDEYAGRPQEGSASSTGSAQPTREPSSATSPTAGPYADGRYSASEAYGPIDDLVEEDSIDVTLTLSEGRITDVDVVGHALTDTSKEHVQRFVDKIDEEVVGRSVEDAHVEALAGASKTSRAFNDAVDAIAEQARKAAATPGATTSQASTP
ncbi:FMN-binding protein [Actinomyces slackii]|uniref:FMN-binding domain n=1 Tax=Actinomyces slackii TaxID=52774 RepID=A0A448KD78_9ACTO|nr:FMN-binding protein [Actinomyces slackii]VEG74877.1 FMN-binding domain [Actinomyces slackii]